MQIVRSAVATKSAYRGGPHQVLHTLLPKWELRSFVALYESGIGGSVFAPGSIKTLDRARGHGHQCQELVEIGLLNPKELLAKFLERRCQEQAVSGNGPH